MRLLTEDSGVAVFEDGPRLVFADRGTRHAYTAGFVLGLVTFNLGALGLVMLIMAVTGRGGHLGVGLGALLVAGGTGYILSRVVAAVRRRRALGPDALERLAVIDLAAGQLCDGDGRVLAPLASVHFGRRMQIGSSSPALVASFAGQRLLLARGNPFAGGIAGLEAVLSERGLMR